MPTTTTYPAGAAGTVVPEPAVAGAPAFVEPAPGSEYIAAPGEAAAVPAPASVAQAAPGWDAEWESRFRDLLGLAGLTDVEVAEQLSQVRDTPLTEPELVGVYTDMRAAMGAWDAADKQRFTAVMDQLDMPAGERPAVFAALASQGLDQDALDKVYEDMQSQLPGWDDGWNRRFVELGLPDAELGQLRKSRAPDSALQELYDKHSAVRTAHADDGRLGQLQDAEATDAETWAVMRQDLEGKEFQTAVDGIRSGNVSWGTRGLEVGLNFVPGFGLAQYAYGAATGENLVTGERYDATNPLNIGMAALSVIPAAAAVKGGVQAVRGASALTTGIKAGTAGAATVDALAAAGTVGKFARGLSTWDKARMVVPGVNRFGEAGKLYGASRGFAQGEKFLDAFRTAELARRGATAGAAGADDGARLTRLGVERDVAALREATAFTQTGGVWRFNPFRNHSTVAAQRVGEAGRTGTAVTLGRGVNPASTGGMAQIRGSIGGAGLDAAPAGLRTNAMRQAGVDPAVAANVGSQSAATAAWAERLGVSNPAARIALLRGESDRAALAAMRQARVAASPVANLARGGSSWANKWLLAPTAGMAGVGVASGMYGHQMQPVWDRIRDPEGRAADHQAEAAAVEEQQRLAAQWRERQAAAAGDGGGGSGDGGTGGAGRDAGANAAAPARPDASSSAPAGAASPASTDAAPPASTDAATEPVLVLDPTTGWYVEPTSGFLVDPKTGTVIDGRTGQNLGRVDPAEIAALVGGTGT